MSDLQAQIVDIRDVRELAEGTVIGAFHAPRCMLEFWGDPPVAATQENICARG
jgi:rhodanese-related sulfurtransferase